ncbi:MAG TPA: VOC family protein [Devosiaceae bacterium]|jgi:catechol 2,3-dioxygenase-like lactoylglutathione lyase family enzyme
MTQSIATIALVVADYDDAIAFYRDRLGFEVIEDTDLGAGKRWVLVSPPGNGGARLLLAKASDARQQEAIGNQAGGRVGFFLETDDLARDHAAYVVAGVSFIRAPVTEAYGTVAVFADLYGNRWDLIEPKRLPDV